MIVKILTILSAILINCSCGYYFELYFMAAFSNILLLHSYDFLLHSSWFVVAFSMIYWCIYLYYLLLPSLLSIAALPMIYCCMAYDLLLHCLWFFCLYCCTTAYFWLLHSLFLLLKSLYFIAAFTMTLFFCRLYDL